MRILGVQNALRSIKVKCVACRKSRAQTITTVKTDLLDKWLNASTDFTYVLGDNFWEETKWDDVIYHMSNYESGAFRSFTRCPQTIVLEQSCDSLDKVANQHEHQWQWGKLCWSWTRTGGLRAAWNREGMEGHLIQQGIRCKFNLPVVPHFG